MDKRRNAQGITAQSPAAIKQSALAATAGGPASGAAASTQPASAAPYLEARIALGQGSAADEERNCDPVLETAVLLDSVIHDLRTPLSAMSGWLEVLEAHFGEADGIVGRALLGLRRGVDSQAAGLSGLSDVLMKQRIDLPVGNDCLLLERMQLALSQMEGRADSPLDGPGVSRLAPFKLLDPSGSLKCQDAGSSLNDACGTLLHALAAAQDAADSPLSILASPNKVSIMVPGGSGDPSALKSLCCGLSRYSAKRTEIRAQALWLARSMFQRCGLSLRMDPATGGGFDLVLTRAQQA